MSEQAIDAPKFARSGRRLKGVIPVEGLHRLRDVLHVKEGNVEYELVGGVDPQGRPYLDLNVQTVLALTCQRCLGELRHNMSLDVRYLLVASEAEATRLEKQTALQQGLEVLVVETSLNIEPMIEDEVMLALPYSPRHEKEACRSAA
jgi:uncharacterized protein